METLGMTTVHRSGQHCPRSGQYAVIWIGSGEPTGHERTVLWGDIFPETEHPGQGYVLKAILRK